jgi:hypothetical protein
MVAVMAGAALALVLTGCGPKGGTLTLVNESSFTLNSPSISLGGGSEDTLAPGGWMKSSIDKNISGARVKFGLTDGEDLVVVSRSGNWALKSRWSSSLIEVHDGDSVVVTVTNKTK